MVGRWAVCLVVVVAGCFDPAFQAHPRCGPGDECPANTKCLRDTCVATGCDGDAHDGDPCANTNVLDGVCYRTGCVPVGCGDGQLEPGEVCDDGNQVSGDGCSGDCQSNETCGNGHLDASEHEECDDSVAGQSGDGCSSRCTVEVLDWRAAHAQAITPRHKMTLGYDAGRQRVVMSHGETSLADDSGSDEIWESDGTNWLIRHATGTSCAGELVYDDKRHRLVVPLPAPCEYDGVHWETHATPTPEPMCDGATYDPIHARVECYANHQLWAYDGNDWQIVATTSNPPVDGPMVFDLASGCALLFRDQTYTLCDTTWAPVVGSHPLPGGPNITYDTDRQRAVVFDGHSTWELVAHDWQLRATASRSGTLNSLPETGFAITYNVKRHRTLLFGGRPDSAGPSANTWEWDGTTWTQIDPSLVTADQPDNVALTFDRARGRIIAVNGQTWELDRGSWHVIATAHPAPSIESGGVPAVAYDEDRHVVIAVGGGRVAELDGTDWIDRTFATMPPVSKQAHLVYDSVHHTSVLVVGDPGVTSFVQTWLYDGTAWTQIEGPRISRRDFGVAFDATRGRVVLFGGATSFSITSVEDVNDLWEFDGTSWTKRDDLPDPIPAPREEMAFAYDARRGRIVMFGGVRTIKDPVPAPGIAFDETWAYDGAKWTQLTTASVPVGGISGPMAFDDASGALVLLDDETWTLSFASIAAPADLCAAGFDSDGDGMIACGDATHPADPDCAAYCAHCGDGICEREIEAIACPRDCP